jgi:type VI secretion system secreted protein Hcp
MHLCATGEHIVEGILTVRKAGKTALEYIIIKMTKIMVTSVSTGGSGGEERLTENVSLNFAKVQFDYREQKPDGTGEAAKIFKWDMQANKAQ